MMKALAIWCWRCLLAMLLACLGAVRLAGAAEYRPLPPAPAPGLSADNWLLHDAARNRLILYLPGYHAPAHAYYQWVRLRPGQPIRVSFAAQPGFGIFLDNKLLLRAGKAGSYSVDLAQNLPRQAAAPHLLAVWQPDGYPALGSFTVVASNPTAEKVPASASHAGAAPLPARLQAGTLQSQSLLLGLLLMGLLYGAVRSAYPAGLANALQVSDMLSVKGNPQAFLVRPAFTLLNLVLVLLFSLSLALLLTALHTDFSSLPLVKQLLKVPETATLSKIGLYTGLILSFIIGKLVLVEGLSYIFDLRPLATLHYREFLRTTLVMGLLVPIALFLFLSLNAYWPPIVGIANGFVLVLLSVTVLRVAQTLHQRASLLNLHLFAYLCATEILPLAVLLKLIVFTSPL